MDRQVQSRRKHRKQRKRQKLVLFKQKNVIFMVSIYKKVDKHNMNKKDIITVQEASIRYRVSRDTLYGLFQDGLIKGYRPGKRKILLYKDSVERYLLSKSNI